MMDGKYPFRTSFTVRVGDINYGGHMGNDRFLLLFQDARIRFLESLGCSEKDIGGGVGLIMSDACISYKREAFLGDTLAVSVTVDRIEAVRFQMNYRVEREADSMEIASGHTNLAAFDYDNRKVARVPDSFKEKIRRQNPD